jgi:hypothetical protein
MSILCYLGWRRAAFAEGAPEGRQPAHAAEDPGSVLRFSAAAHDLKREGAL